jgi:hypothetical protein
VDELRGARRLVSGAEDVRVGADEHRDHVIFAQPGGEHAVGVLHPARDGRVQGHDDAAQLIGHVRDQLRPEQLIRVSPRACIVPPDREYARRP